MKFFKEIVKKKYTTIYICMYIYYYVKDVNCIKICIYVKKNKTELKQ